MYQYLPIVSALLPVLVLVYYIYRRDKLQPEPPAQLWKGAGWGVLSVAVTFILLIPIRPIQELFGGTDTLLGCVGTSFLGAAIPEECAKALCLYWFLKNNKYFDEYMDGPVYAVTVGMGFAGVENILYVCGAEDWIVTSLMRALMAVPGHFAFAILMGYFYSLWRIKGQTHYMYLMLAAPILAHGIYDTLCFTIGLSTSTNEGGAAMLLMVAMVVFLHYMRKQCSRLIAKHLAKDESLMQQA